MPVPGDVQLFIQAVHIMTFVDCRADLVAQLNTDGLERMLRTPPVKNFWLYLAKRLVLYTSFIHQITGSKVKKIKKRNTVNKLVLAARPV